MQLLQTALAAIYPPRCLACGGMVDSDFGLCGTCWGQTQFVGRTRCDMCSVPLPGQSGGETLQCDDCMRAPKPWEQGRAALIYEGIGRKLVLGFKHGDRQEVATPAARWMLNACRDMLDHNVLIAPVPLHWMRLAKRRYNQSALLACALSDLSGCDWCPDLLVRTQYTPSLDGKSREMRQGILSGALGDYFDYNEVSNGVTQAVENYATTEQIDDALAWITNQTSPWTCTVAFTAPHSPWHVPPAHHAPRPAASVSRAIGRSRRPA